MGLKEEREGKQREPCLKEVGESMSGSVDSKVLQEDLEKLDFTLSLVKPEIGKDVGRGRVRS